MEIISARCPPHCPGSGPEWLQVDRFFAGASLEVLGRTRMVKKLTRGKLRQNSLIDSLEAAMSNLPYTGEKLLLLSAFDLKTGCPVT